MKTHRREKPVLQLAPILPPLPPLLQYCLLLLYLPTLFQLGAWWWSSGGGPTPGPPSTSWMGRQRRHHPHLCNPFHTCLILLNRHLPLHLLHPLNLPHLHLLSWRNLWGCLMATLCGGRRSDGRMNDQRIFSQVSHLKRHFKTHSGDKSKQCSVTLHLRR